MIRTSLSCLAVGLALSVVTLISGDTVSGDTIFRSAYHDYRVVTVVEALVQPWSIAFLPDGDVLITERPGRLRILRR
jgi:glucose/arabinose dehydrogenase